MTDKVVIGLTGNIATGKSLILRMLQELGAAVIDADKLVHQLMNQGGPVYQAIVEEFGRFVLDDNGQINRARLGKIAFTLPEALGRLEEITHPNVIQEVLNKVEKSSSQVVAVEAIKLFESGLAEHCHVNWVVTARPEVQLKRLVERRRMAPQQAQQRIKAQPPQQKKMEQADLVIDNSGDLAKTWLTVKKQYTNLLQKEEAVTAQPAVEATAAAEPTSTPAVPATSAKVTNDVTLRRAKRNDLEAMAELISIGTNGALTPDSSQMLENLFSRAYLVAMASGYVIGMAGWQTENLIAGLQDFYVLRDDLWSTVGQQILDKVHEEIDSLSCEVSLVFVREAAGTEPVEFFQQAGYEQAESKDLGYMWKEAATEMQPENSVLLYKKLREQRIMVPM